MPKRRPPKLTGKNGKPLELIINAFKKGTITLLDAGRVPQDGVTQSQNMMLDQDGVWRPRYGSTNYGASLTGPLDGMSVGVVYSSDGTNTNYLFVMDNGSLKYCTDGGSWTTVSGMSWTAGHQATMLQVGNKLWITNGKENLSYLDLTSFTMTTFTALSTPGTVTLTVTGVSSPATYSVYYKVTAVKNNVGETAASAEATVKISAIRQNWNPPGATSFANYITLSWTAVSGADSYNIYYSSVASDEVYIANTTTNSYVDTGVAAQNFFQAAPLTDGTAGIAANIVRWSDNRMWFDGGNAHPQRVYWSGDGQNLGSLNPFYGAGYVDLNLGGTEKVVDVRHYRSGSGAQMAVAFTSSPSGGGSVWFIPLSSLSTDSLQIIVPNPVSQDTVGTTSTRGAVVANNNVFYPSILGFQSIGSAPNIINVIMTTDVSAIIRPSVLGINQANSSQICGIYYYGRIYWSVPYGSSTNNQIWILDLERQAWTIGWNLGVKQFQTYTDNSGVLHLLAIPVSGTKLIEIKDGLTNDNGKAYSTNLQSGLVYWDKNHFDWAWVQKVYVELGRPRGNIQFNISGAGPNKNLQLLKSISFNDTYSSSGLGADQLGSVQLGQSNEMPNVTASTSTKKVIYINKTLNYLQWQLTSSDSNQSYSLLEIGVKGFIIEQGDPSTWRK